MNFFLTFSFLISIFCFPFTLQSIFLALYNKTIMQILCFYMHTYAHVSTYVLLLAFEGDVLVKENLKPFISLYYSTKEVPVSFFSCCPSFALILDLGVNMYMSLRWPCHKNFPKTLHSLINKAEFLNSNCCHFIREVMKFLPRLEALT